jgi:hypothetical protein
MWTKRESGVTSILNGISYGNGLFVAVGGAIKNGTILTSPDGFTWTIQESGFTGGVSGITYANGLFAALGSAALFSTILTSPDGVTWTSQIASPYALFGICYGNGLFAVVGGGGTVLTSLERYLIAGVPATNETFGVVQVDGTSIVSNSGVISAVGDARIPDLQNQITGLKAELAEIRQMITQLK